jgi:hypothetical protein
MGPTGFAWTGARSNQRIRSGKGTAKEAKSLEQLFSTAQHSTAQRLRFVDLLSVRFRHLR